jgi:hypothetical protein
MPIAAEWRISRFAFRAANLSIRDKKNPIAMANQRFTRT